MTDAPLVVRARENAPTPIAPPVALASRPLSEIVEQAEMLSKAGDAVPKAYRGSPGACLLAVDLAGNVGKPLLWVMQNVAFINGRAIIEGNGIIDIAADNDYSITLTELDDQHATVVLADNRSGEKVGEWTSTLADANRNNPIWKSHPKQMLRSNAIRNVWKFYGKPRGGAFLISADEIVEADIVDPLDVLAPPANLFGEPDQHAGFPPAATETELKAMIAAAERKPADILRQYPGKSLADIAADPALLAEVVAQLEGE